MSGLGELFDSSETEESFEDFDESPLRWALLGLEHAGNSVYGDTTPDELREWLDSDISDSSVQAVKAFENSRSPQELARAIQKLDLQRVDIGEAMEVAEDNVKYLEHNGHQPKTFRYSYIPKVIEDAHPDGTVYMCKSVNGQKAMMAWDLNSKNIVVQVENYEKYDVLGWEKLKQFPHGSKQIREQYGDQLSDAVLDELCDDDVKKSQASPSSERLTISTGKRNFDKYKMTAEDVGDEFEEDGMTTKGSITRLVLFPTGSTRNLSDHWWIAGRVGDDEYAAVANCNKKTYKYLSQYEQVYHIDDYISAADDVEVLTDSGKKRLGDLDDFVVYTVSEKSRKRYVEGGVLDQLPRVLAEAIEDKFEPPDMDSDDTVVLVSPDGIFEARPALRESNTVLSTDKQIRDLGTSYDAGHEYIIYAKCRLDNWNWDSIELSAFAENCWNLDFDNGGYELVETLAELHDNGKPLYSESPERRWEQ